MEVRLLLCNPFLDDSEICIPSPTFLCDVADVFGKLLRVYIAVL